MRHEQAETAANVIIGLAAASAAFLVLRDRTLRRAAWFLIRRAAAASGPWLLAEAREAWAQSGQAGAAAPSEPARGTGARI